MVTLLGQRMKLKGQVCLEMEATNLLILWALTVSVKADFNFTVRFYEYWNPTGLCAECGTNGVPVCCDDPQRIESCQNTGVFRCDTRFRFIQRPFNASLETAPNPGFPDFTPSITNSNHEIFREGPAGFLSLPNPHTHNNVSPWTGRIQFLVDALDRINNNQAPNETEGIIDRFVINLDQLQLGANLTERTNYTGIYNISQLAMSFRVECSENYYGSDCTTFCEAVEGVYNCDSDGNIICIKENRDPLMNCTKCLPGYFGDSCVNESVSVALIGGVVGGVVIVILVLALSMVIVCLIFQQRRRQQKCSKTTENSGIKLQKNIGYGVHTTHPVNVELMTKNEAYGVTTFTTKPVNDELETNEAYSVTTTQPSNVELEKNEAYGVTTTQAANVELEKNEAYGVTTTQAANVELETYGVTTTQPANIELDTSGAYDDIIPGERRKEDKYYYVTEGCARTLETSAEYEYVQV